MHDPASKVGPETIDPPAIGIRSCHECLMGRPRKKPETFSGPAWPRQNYPIHEIQIRKRTNPDMKISASSICLVLLVTFMACLPARASNNFYVKNCSAEKLNILVYKGGDKVKAFEQKSKIVKPRSDMTKDASSHKLSCDRCAAFQSCKSGCHIKAQHVYTSMGGDYYRDIGSADVDKNHHIRIFGTKSTGHPLDYNVSSSEKSCEAPRSK